MRRLWNCSKLDDSFPKGTALGVKLCFNKGTDPEVRRACIAFLRWLRKEYIFPRRIIISISDTEQVFSNDGNGMSSVFWGPFDKRKAPKIQVAAGDYYQLLESRGKDNALASILHSIAFQLGCYFQWVQDLPASRRQAQYYAREILLDYADTRDHP